MKLHIEESTDKNIFYNDSEGRTWKYRIATNLGEELKRFYIKNADTYVNNSCFMISACRGENGEELNKIKTDKLAKDIRSYNLGYIRVLGGYAEDTGTDNEVEVTGELFFVPQPENISDEEFFNIAIELCRKYKQDSVLISMPECTDNCTGYIGFGYYTGTGEFDFSTVEKISFTDDAVKQYFSLLIKGGNCNKKTEWLAVRNPNSFTQAVLMDKNKENLLFKVKK